MIVLNKILIVNLGGMADVLFSMPAVNAIKRRYPDAKITILVAQKAKDAASQMMNLEKIEFVDHRHFGSEFLNVIKRLRQEKFDLAINMRSITNRFSALKIRLLFAMIAAKKSAGWDTAGMGYFFDIKIKEPVIADKHEIEYHIDTACALDAKVDDKAIHLAIDEKSMDSILVRYAILPGEIVIGIHPGGMPSRRWPGKNFVELIDALSKNSSAKIVFTGSKQERPLTNELQSLCRQPTINSAGELSFIELCALIKRCNLFISNDTGPMHIAAILDRPLIAIIGPGQIKRYDPRIISNNAVVFYKGAECSPCNRYYCKKQDCLTSIDMRDVYDSAVSELVRVR